MDEAHVQFPMPQRQTNQYRYDSPTFRAKDDELALTIGSNFGLGHGGALHLSDSREPQKTFYLNIFYNGINQQGHFYEEALDSFEEDVSLRVIKMNLYAHPVFHKKADAIRKYVSGTVMLIPYEKSWAGTTLHMLSMGHGEIDDSIPSEFFNSAQNSILARATSAEFFGVKLPLFYFNGDVRPEDVYATVQIDLQQFGHPKGAWGIVLEGKEKKILNLVGSVSRRAHFS
jgi:hypothetical protein